MSEIVFEDLYDSPETLGTGIALLPALVAFGLEPVGAYGFALLPKPTAVGSGAASDFVTGTGVANLGGLESFGSSYTMVIYVTTSGWGVGYLPMLATRGYDPGVLVPSDGAGIAVLPRLTAAGTGSVRMFGSGAGTLPALKSFGLQVAGNWGVAALPKLTTTGVETVVVPTRFFSLMQSPGYTEIFVSDTIYDSLVSIAEGSDQLTFRGIANFRDIARATEDLRTSGHLYSALADMAKASESIQQVIVGVLADSASAAEAFSMIYMRFEELRDTATANDAMLTSWTSGVSLLSTAVAMELMARGYDMDLLDTAVGSEVLMESLRGVSTLLSVAEASAEFGDALRIVMKLGDVAMADDELTSTGEFLALLESGAEATAIIRIGDIEYVAWVMNADNMGTTQYQNFGFNSFAQVPGGMYGAREDGLYLLEGNDDDGENIKAWIRSGLTNFGTGSLKALPMMYIGLTADGDLLLTVSATSPEGAKTEYTYRMTERTANATRENRVKIGKGIRSVYWQWTLENTEGSDFSVDTTRLWPMMLSRRIR